MRLSNKELQRRQREREKERGLMRKTVLVPVERELVLDTTVKTWLEEHKQAEQVAE